MTQATEIDNQFEQWIGNTESVSDTLLAAPLNALAATLDRSQSHFVEGQQVPPLWHWLYGLKVAPRSELGHDGHPKKGGFLPPIDLPRRMWAGSRVTFHHDLKVGQECTKTSSIRSINFKSGRSGRLAFVNVLHETENGSGVAISEEQDIVYREQPSLEAVPSVPKPAPPQHDYSMQVDPDPILLFRYSALTLNSHRIHYDRDYAIEQEGYSGLIVHGPLLATYMVELLASQFLDKRLKYFEFKALSPVFDQGEFLVCGLNEDDEGRCKVWVENGSGGLCMLGFGVFD